MADVDIRDFRRALGQFATGVTVITTIGSDGCPVGVTASSFNSVSLNPPLVLWSLDKSAASLPAFSGHGYFAVHVLAAGQEDISNCFARRGEDKFANINYAPGLGGIPLLPECAACFQCKLAYQYEGGDHVIFVGEVERYCNFERSPLVFHGGAYAHAKPKVDGQATLESAFLVDEGGGFSANFIGYLISRAHYGLHQPLLKDVVGMGFKEAHYFILSVLCIKNNLPMRQCSEFLAHVGIDPSAADCLEMERLGLISVSGGDEEILNVTALGRSSYKKLLNADIAREKNALQDFNPEELSEFIGYLSRFVRGTSPDVPDIWS